MSALQLAEMLEQDHDISEGDHLSVALMLRKQDAAIRQLREALAQMNDVFSDRESGEIDRKLAIKDARIALAATENME